MTKQRATIFTIIKQYEGKHHHVYDLYKLAKKKDPKINLSTVYRTLNEFKKANVVEELHLEQEHHHYEIKEKKEHQHLICEKCDAVIEFSMPTKPLKEQLAKQYGFFIKKMHVNVSGICRKCRIH